MAGLTCLGQAQPATRPAAAATAGTVTIQQHDTDLVVQIDGTPFTTYRFAPTPDDPHWQRPYFWPVLMADGTEITSDQTRVAEKDPKTDHPHQRSIWVGHGDVNGANHWTRSLQQQRHVRFTKVEGDTFVEELTWDAKDAPPTSPVLTETRTVRFFAYQDGARAIEIASEFTAPNGNVNFKCKPLNVSGVEAGLCSVRVAKPITDGPDTAKWITTSAPASGEQEARQKSAAWCDYTGLIHGQKYGIAMVNWPKNPGGDRPWHVRKFGLLAHIGPLNWMLPDHTSATFKHLIILHKEDPDLAAISVKAKAWRGK
jgi:hypothetical protein